MKQTIVYTTRRSPYVGVEHIATIGRLSGIGKTKEIATDILISAIQDIYYTEYGSKPIFSFEDPILGYDDDIILNMANVIGFIPKGVGRS